MSELALVRQKTIRAIASPFAFLWRVIRGNVFITLFCLTFTTLVLAIILVAPAGMFDEDFWLSSPEDVRTLVLLFASVGGAAIAIIGLWLSGKRARAALQQSHITQENHYTDLLVRASEQVSHENLLVRLVGIHSLERVARHSEQDRPAVASILAQFLQQNLMQVEDFNITELRKRATEAYRGPVRGDVAAAAEALSRAMDELDDNFSIGLRSVVLPSDGTFGSCRGWNFEKCVFLDSELDGASFHGCTFKDTKFFNCSFNIAWFNKSSFENVLFSSCRFPTTGLVETTWQGGHYIRLYFGRSYFNKAAFFSSAFTECDFHHVDFRGARFFGARFVKCDFSGAYLDECVFQNAKETFSDCMYHRSNPPFVSKEVPLNDANCFRPHDNPQGELDTQDVLRH